MYNKHDFLTTENDRLIDLCVLCGKYLYNKLYLVHKMLFVSIPQLSLVQQIGKLPIGIELRLDLFPSVHLEEIKSVLSSSPHPVLLTYRGADEDQIEKLLELEPPFFDLQWDLRPAFLQSVFQKCPKTKFILSYHNFEEVPHDLEGIYRLMRQYPAFSYKIAVTPLTTNDALKVLLFAKAHEKVSAICMGESGKFARVLSPVVGNLVNYACLNEEAECGPGQLSVRELLEVYRYATLTTKTAIFGLIGDPVETSRGAVYHNLVFQELGLDAVYVKMRVPPEELAEFIPLAQKLGVRGLSVTAPLKERVLPFIAVGEPMGAVNTLLFDEGQIWGANTDGKGALDAIEKRGKVQGKRMVLLGAGGAARAIAFEARARGAEVWVLNRTRSKAEALSALAGDLSEVPAEYDIMVNCSSDPMPIDAGKIRPKSIVMDVRYSPRITPFLEQAAIRGCELVLGEEMFLNQAAGQTRFWGV